MWLATRPVQILNPIEQLVAKIRWQSFSIICFVMGSVLDWLLRLPDSLGRTVPLKLHVALNILHLLIEHAIEENEVVLGRCLGQ